MKAERKLTSISTLFLGCIGTLFANDITDVKSVEEKKNMNVLFFFIDDLKPELASFGHNYIHSPNIDELANEGVAFSNAYCQVPVSGATRASLLSGVRPSKERFVQYHTWLEKDCPQAIPMSEYFKQNGYETISYGKVFHNYMDCNDSWTEKWSPSVKHWRDYQIKENMNKQLQTKHGPAYERADVPDNAYIDGRVAEKAVEKIKELASNKKPFFMAVGFVKPHLPFNAPEKYWAMYDKKDIRLPENYRTMPENSPKKAWHGWHELRDYDGIPQKGNLTDEQALTLRHGYYACVSYTDAQIGKVMKALKDSGLDNNTIVVLIGDHGWSLGEHTLWCKHSTFKNCTNPPMIIRLPNAKAKGISKALVEYVDIYPTLCDYTGLRQLSQLHGKSLRPVLENPSIEFKDAVFSRYIDAESVKTKRYQYTEWYDKGGKIVARMLYDHYLDERENVNVSEWEEYNDVVLELSSKLEDNRKNSLLK